jgi:hypothetical protein
VSKKNKKGALDSEILSKHSKIEIPVSVLRRRPLTTFEALVVFLKEEYGLNYHNIAVLLDRNERGIRIIYYRAKDKLKRFFRKSVLITRSGIKIPLKVLRKRPMTTYEALVVFLREVLGFNYHNLALILDRNERDVRKVYYRAKAKNVK